MKKKILFISVFLLAVFVYLKRSPQEVEQLVEQEKTSSTSPTLKKETKKQRQPKPVPAPSKKRKDQTSNTFNQKEYLDAKNDFQNFNIDTETLLDNWKKEKLQKYLTQASSELLQCLEVNLCGEQEPVDSPYFNPDYTDSHTYLEHNLGHLVFLHERGELNHDQLTDDFLQRLLTLKNEGIQQKAIELKLAKGVDSKNYDELLRLTEGLMSKASLSSLAVLSQYSQKSSQHRQTFILLKESLRTTTNSELSKWPNV